ncbi:MAG: hypothetical protein U1E45_22140 [Geminicoccaceae bacterium]
MKRSVANAASVLALAALMVGLPVRADILATSTRATNITTLGLLPLNEAGNTALAFTTSADRQKVVITYNADCYTKGPLFIDMTVDGARTNPNSGGIVLCSSNTTPNLEFVSAIRQVVYTAPKKGRHFVEIRIRTMGAPFAFDIRNTSPVVMD